MWYRLTASSASRPSASIITVSPQLRLAVSTSRMLAAENRSAPLTSQTWERKAFAARTNCAAGRAWRPNSLTIVISCRLATASPPPDSNPPSQPLNIATRGRVESGDNAMIGGFISGHPTAYRYLPESVAKFPTGDELARRMHSAGFAKVRWRQLTFGVVAIHVGERDKGAGV